MVQFAPVQLPPALRATAAPPFGEARFRIEDLLLASPRDSKSRATTLGVSVVAHIALIALVVLIPILTYDSLPAPGEAARAFFAAPRDVAAPPPPPPPPPAGARAIAKAPAAPAIPETQSKFLSPTEVPDTVDPEKGIDIGAGEPGGVPGGVEGGVPGGVPGGIVGGMPTPPPPTLAPKVVRVGGQIKSPELIYRVPPEYPELAVQARLAAIVIVEALVGLDGRVKSVTVLRGAPLFDEPAVAAVKQWRYKPLLLNGMPTEFLLTATVKFRIDNIAPPAPGKR
jgi:protein TonB